MLCRTADHIQKTKYADLLQGHVNQSPNTFVFFANYCIVLFYELQEKLGDPSVSPTINMSLIVEKVEKP